MIRITTEIINTQIITAINIDYIYLSPNPAYTQSLFYTL